MADTFRPVIIHQPPGDLISPVVFDNPHSGYSESWLWDAFLDRLLADVPQVGVPVLETDVPRTIIDTNRDIDEIDPSVFQEPWPYSHKLTVNVRNGMGLIPYLIKRRDGTLIQAFNEHSQLTVSEVKRRIDEYYKPYYNALICLINQSQQQHGIAIHFNFHSTPRQGTPHHQDIILGNLKGKSCSPALLGFVQDFFKKEGLTTGLNKPYPGGALIRRTHNPEQGCHSLQIELARDLYMDQSSLTYDPHKGGHLKDTLTRLAKEVRQFSLTQADTLRP